MQAIHRTGARFSTPPLLVLVILGVPVQADVIHVPADYPNIQDAIEAASDGDEIIVAPGTYREVIDLLGKAIYLRSSAGADRTRIDAHGQPGSVVTCLSGEGPDTIIEGLTIKGGIGTPEGNDRERNGGGIYVRASDPTIRDCDILQNNVSGEGGGIYTSGSSPTIERCRVFENSAVRGGGGIATRGGSPVIRDCVVADNSCAWTGGGMNTRGFAAIVRCVFVGNSARTSGGGLATWESDATVEDSIFNGNSAGRLGGGVFLGEDTGHELANCFVSGNEAAVGGGVYLEQTSSTLMNCVLVGNRATLGGALVGRGSSRAQVVNSTFSGNAATVGGAYYFEGGGTGEDVALTNCILWGDKPREIEGGVSVTYCDVQGGASGEGNIDADPGFSTLHTGAWTRRDWAWFQVILEDETAQWSPDEFAGLVVQPDVAIDKQFLIVSNDETTLTVWTDWVELVWLRPGASYAIYDHRPGPGAPTIDAGNNDAVPPDTFDLDGDDDTEEPTPFDYDGNPRFADHPDTEDTGIGCIVLDMGPYEFPAEGPGRNAAPPLNLQASDGDYADRISVSWSPPQCIDEYRVYRNIEDDPESSVPITDWQRDTAFDDTSAEPGQVYWYWAKARNERGESDWSEGDRGLRFDRPPPPTGLTATDADYVDRVQVLWEPSHTAEQYLVLRHVEDEVSHAEPISNWQRGRGFNDRTAEPGRVYFYWVRARNVNGEGHSSESDCGSRRDPDRCVRSRHSCCDGDVTGDGLVNPVDLGLVQANFGNLTDQALCDYDIDCDGQINPIDAGIVQSLFGTCEAPREMCP